MPKTAQSPDGPASAPAAHPETLAAILAEMRGNEFDDPHLDADGIIGARRLARDWADRIEAAAERELSKNRPKNGDEIGQFGNAACEAWKKICAACAEGTQPARCAYYGDPNGCNAPTLGKHPEGDLAERLQEALEKAERRIAELERAPGNAAALREALDDAHRLIEAFLATVGDRGMRSKFVEMRHRINAALAAPARNVDRPGCRTRDEAWKVFERESAGMWAADWDAAFTAWLFDTKEEGAK